MWQSSIGQNDFDEAVEEGTRCRPLRILSAGSTLENIEKLAEKLPSAPPLRRFPWPLALLPHIEAEQQLLIAHVEFAVGNHRVGPESAARFA
jgi:hypothetical protein